MPSNQATHENKKKESRNEKPQQKVWIDPHKTREREEDVSAVLVYKLKSA